jgi:hypothetical protein
MSDRFIAMFIVMIGLSFGTVLGYPTHLTWWALIIALIISAVWMVNNHSSDLQRIFC